MKWGREIIFAQLHEPDLLIYLCRPNLQTEIASFRQRDSLCQFKCTWNSGLRIAFQGNKNHIL